MLRRFQQLAREWRSELEQLEAQFFLLARLRRSTSEDPRPNESFPDLQTEQDWAESVRQHSVKDGEFLIDHVRELQQRIAAIDVQVEVLNERLHRPESARMVALSLFYWAPENVVPWNMLLSAF